jgi:hypothetical protein
MRGRAPLSTCRSAQMSARLPMTAKMNWYAPAVPLPVPPADPTSTVNTLRPDSRNPKLPPYTPLTACLTLPTSALLARPCAKQRLNTPYTAVIPANNFLCCQTVRKACRPSCQAPGNLPCFTGAAAAASVLAAAGLATAGLLEASFETDRADLAFAAAARPRLVVDRLAAGLALTGPDFPDFFAIRLLYLWF